MEISSAGEFENAFPFQEEISEQIRFLLTAAVRAPSTHNCQPWRFKIEEDRLFVYRDTRIKLPQSDSTGRYAHVSIGFLLHHMMTLGEWLSMQPKLVIVMKNDCIAEITFLKAEKGKESSSIVNAIFKRRNRRGVFEPKPVPQQVLEEATQSQIGFAPAPEVQVVTDASATRRLAELTATVMRRVYAGAPFRREMSGWITPNDTLRKDGIPGYSLNQPKIVSWILPTLIRFVNMGRVLAKVNYKMIVTAPAAFGFGSEDDPTSWVSVGYTASHAALTLVAYDFDYSVFVATMQYDDTRRVAGETFGLHQPLQFLFVTGTFPGKVTWMTPRVSVDDKLMAL